MSIYPPTPRVANRLTATMIPNSRRAASTAPPAPTPQIPNSPTGVSLAQGPAGSLIVTWTAPVMDSSHDAATGFNLQSSPSGAGTWTTVSGVTSPYTLSGLATGAAFDVQVAGWNLAGVSAWSPISTLATVIAPPYSPGAASLTQGAGSTLTAIWNAPPTDSTHNAATAYALRSSPSGAGTWTTVSNVVSPYTLIGLAAAAAIDVQLQSSNAAGPSPWSATSTLTTTTAGPYAPNVPSAATVTQGTGSSLIVSWTAPASDSVHGLATAYALRSSPSGAGTWTTVANVTSPYTLSGLAAGAAIDVQIQSSNAAGSSAWSATTTHNASAAAYAPNAPAAGVLAQAGSGSLTVTWTAPAVDSTHNAATVYSLRSSPSGAGTWTTVSNVTSPYTLSGLGAGAPIDVQIQGSNVSGASAWSATSTLTTASAGGALAPNAPAIATVAGAPDGTTSKLVVTWAAPAVDATHGAATAFNLRSSPTGANTWTTVSNVTSPYTLTGLGGATAIDVQVQGTNAAASPGAWSTVVTGTTWGAAIVPGGWTAAATQSHGASVAPNGGVQMLVTAAPTPVTGAAFAWSAGNTAVPTSGLVAAGADGQTNGWGQYLVVPAATGTYYLWMLAQGAGAVTTGALVTSAITVT